MYRILSRAGLTLAMLLPFCLLAACQHVETGSVETSLVTSPNDSRDYATLVLDNGLAVLLVSDPAVEKSAAALSVGVGLLQDPMAYQGMAHYLEHMLFLGTEKYPEPDGYMAFMSRNGGTNNAYTWLDITNYMFVIDNPAYDEALDRFSDFFKAPLLLPEYIEKEKNAVHAEWSMRREMDEFAMFRLGRSLLGDHPANRFLIGNLESLADKPGQSLHAATVDFHQRYYSANLMKLALISPLPIEALQTLAWRHFGAIPDQAVARPGIEQALDFSRVGGQRIHYVPQQDRRQLTLEFIIDNNADQFRHKPNEYLAYIIGSEMPDSLAALFKQRGWASSLSVHADPKQFGNYGVFTIAIEVTPEGMPHRDAMLELVLGYLDLLREQGVPDHYATEFRTSLDNRFRFLEKTDDFSYASELAAAMQDYPLEHVIDGPYRFEGVDAAAVNAVLGQLIPERLQAWYVSPEESGEQEIPFYAGRYSLAPLVVPTADQRLAMAREAGLGLPAANALLPKAFAVRETNPEPRRLRDEPGLDVWLQGSRHFPDQPRGELHLHLNTDARQAGPEGSVMLALWADLFLQQQTALVTEAGIAGMDLQVRPDNGLQLTIRGFTDRQPELLGRALRGLQVAPDDQALAQAIDRYSRGIRNARRAFPVRQLFPALTTLVESGGHADEALLEAAGRIDRQRLQAFVDDQLVHNHLRLYLFGNYDRSSAEALLETVLEQLPERQPAGYVRSELYAPQAGVSVARNLDVPVEDLGMLSLYATPEPGMRGIASARVLGVHLANQAFNMLRTEEQLGYAAGGMGRELGDHAVLGLYIQTPVKGPAEMLARLDAFAGEYASQLAELDEASFEQLRAGVLTELTQPPKSQAEEAEPFLRDWYRQRHAFDTRTRLIAAVESLTLADLQQFYRDTVVSEAPSRLLIQLRGQRFRDQPHARLPGARVVELPGEFHREMPRQPR